jgi:hypothetical protein
LLALAEEVALVASTPRLDFSDCLAVFHSAI